MARPYLNDAHIPAVSMLAIEVGSLLDRLPACDICEEQDPDFIVFPGMAIDHTDTVLCERCAAAYLSGARLSKMERRERDKSYVSFIAMLAGNGVWES